MSGFSPYRTKVSTVNIKEKGMAYHFTALSTVKMQQAKKMRKQKREAGGEVGAEEKKTQWLF